MAMLSSALIDGDGVMPMTLRGAAILSFWIFGFFALTIPHSARSQVLEMKPEVREAPELKPADGLGVRETPTSKALVDGFANLPTRLSQRASRTKALNASTSGDSEVLLGSPVGGCPLFFLRFKIEHYRVIYQRSSLDLFATDNDKAPLQQDVCECRFMPGDYAACARNKILSKSVSMPSVNVSNRIEIRLTDPGEFGKLYTHIVANVQPASEPIIFPEPDASGAGNPPPPPPPPSPSPPPTPPSAGQPEFNPEAAKDAEENKCERKLKICISPKDHKFSAEFSVKCKNTPEFTFSTEGETTIKVGHVSISLSPD